MGVRLSKAMTAKVLAMASGEQRKAKSKNLCASPAQPATVRWSFTLTVPTTVVSEINRRDHWTARMRRKNQQQAALAAALNASPCRLAHCWFPATVTFVRIGRMGPHQEQDDDNIRSAFKAMRDHIALGMLIDDGNPRVTWRYEQRAGNPGVEVRIEGGG